MSRVDRSEVRALAGYTTGRPGRRDVYDSLTADTLTTSAISVYNVLHGYVKADSDNLPANLTLPSYSELKDEIKKMVPGLAVRFHVENTGSVDLTLVPGTGGSADGSMLAGALEKTTFALRIDSLTAYTVYRLQHSSATGADLDIWEHATDAVTGDPIVRLDAANPSYATNEGIVCPAQGMDGTGSRFFVDVEEGGAIRAGTTTGTQWDAANRGASSAAFGSNTQVSGNYSTAAGGRNHTVSGEDCFVGGGIGCTVSGSVGAICGGYDNEVRADLGFIGGGGDNGSGNVIQENSDWGAIGGGADNVIGVAPGEIVLSRYNVIGGGQANAVGAANLATHGFLGGGEDNAVTRNHSVLCGGQGNRVDSANCFLGGGGVDTAGATLNQIQFNQAHSVLVGGYGNSIYSNANAGGTNVLVGGFQNSIGVSGGLQSLTSNVICGGTDNSMLSLATDASSGNFIGGGESNTIDGARTVEYAVIAGGFQNNIGYQECVIGGGQSNACTGGRLATIGGGDGNSCTGVRATVGGGSENSAGTNACVPGGVGAVAAQPGEVSAANGYFTSAGDAQGTMQVIARISNNHGTSANADLYADGVATPFFIDSNSSYTVDVLVSGVTSTGAQSWSYEIQANVRTNAAGAVTINAAATNAIYESDATYTAALVSPGANQWNVQAQYGGGGVAYTVRWVAIARFARVTYP